MTIPTAHRRRKASLLAAIVGVALALSGCASAAPGDNADPSTTHGEHFSVTVKHDLGETTLTKKPERIVLLDSYSIDIFASTLDVEPVAFWYANDGEELASSMPWFKGFDTAEVDSDLVSGDFKASPEVIATWEPDLIVAPYWLVDEGIYAQLEKIAPTYVVPSSNTMEDNVLTLGALTGTTEKAEQALNEVENAYTAARERLSGLQGKSFIEAIVWDESTLRLGFTGDLAERLGLVRADNMPSAEELSSADPSDNRISLENIDQLNADVVFIGIHPDPSIVDVLNADPRFADLPAQRNGTLILADAAFADAFGSPGGQLWRLEERILPQLEGSALNKG